MDKAKVFQNGGSQAIRLPKPYRFNTDTVDDLDREALQERAWDELFA